MGEFELLARVRKRLPPAGPRIHLPSGDDAAVGVPGAATATSVDALVEGIHFRRGQASLEQIGGKALAAALSDLAAMGAEAGEAYVVLGIPTDLTEDGCMELLDGVVEVAAATGTTVAGGDLTRSDQLFLALTVVGHASSPDAFVTRGGARPGDAIVVTGRLAGAAAGLLLLERLELTADIPSETAARLRARQLEPRPLLAAGRALADAGATAMIDISDGIGGDCRHVAAASGASLRIEAVQLPLDEGVEEVAQAAGIDPLRLALAGGEDYELLATLPAGRMDEAMAASVAAGATGLTRIGTVVAGEGVELRLPDGRLLEPSGFDQLG